MTPLYLKVGIFTLCFSALNVDVKELDQNSEQITIRAQAAKLKAGKQPC